MSWKVCARPPAAARSSANLADSPLLLQLLCIILRILLYVHCYDYHGYGYQTKFMTCETTGL